MRLWHTCSSERPSLCAGPNPNICAHTIRGLGVKQTRVTRVTTTSQSSCPRSQWPFPFTQKSKDQQHHVPDKYPNQAAISVTITNRLHAAQLSPSDPFFNAKRGTHTLQATLCIPMHATFVKKGRMRVALGIKHGLQHISHPASPF